MRGQLGVTQNPVFPTMTASQARAVFWGLVVLAVIALPPGLASAAADGGRMGLAPTRSAGVPSEQRIRAHFRADSMCIRLAAAGVNTRNASSPTTSGVITLPPGPTASNIQWAGLYWVTLYGNGLQCTQPAPNAVTLNGQSVTPSVAGVNGSPCWFNTTSIAYFADVTPLVIAGGNVVAGLDDGGATGVCTETEGASLVVVYRSTTSTACEVIVMDGNDLISTGATSIDNLMPVSCSHPTPGRLTFVGGDGQPVNGPFFADDQKWNGVALGDGDDFDNSDPRALGAYDGWDTDAWPVVVAPPYTATVSSTSDCINWVATALEVDVHDCVATPNRRSTWGSLKLRYR